MNRAKVIISVLSVFSIISMVGIATAAPVISFEPFNPTAVPGPLDLSIVATGFSNTTLGGGLTISWDPGILELASESAVTFTFPDSQFTGVDLDIAAGMVDVTMSGFFVGASGDFGIVDLAFTAIGTGISPLNIAERNGFPWKNDTGLEDLSPQPTYISGDVKVVPIPSTIILLGGGLLALVSLRRRKS